MNLALVSPLPPAATGVAEFAARLARELSGVANIDCFDRCDPVRLARADVGFYQIGNNRLHDGAYEAALRRPGVIELHDAVLHQFLLGRLTREVYIEEFLFNYGDWLAHRAERLYDGRARSAADEEYFRYPLLRRVVEASRAVIVHNPGAARRVREASRSAHIVEIPHYSDPPPAAEPGQVEALRSRIGLPPEAFVIGCFGYQRPSRRLRSVLTAAAALEPPWRIVVAGQFVDPAYEESLAGLLWRPEIVRLPYLSPRDFWTLARLVDVCVNLRWPSAGETSGIAIKLMAAQKPVVLTKNEENAGYPEDAVVRIDAGEAESEMLGEMLRLLMKEPDLRSHIGAAAARHLLERHAMANLLPLYREALAQAAAGRGRKNKLLQ